MTTAAALEPASGAAEAPEAPRALGTGEPLDRALLLGAPLRSVPRPSLLGASLDSIRGIGPKLAEAAERIGLLTLGDLVEHFPHSYRDRASAVRIADLKLAQEATIVVEVRSARLRPTRRRGLSIVEATVADASGPLQVSWFNQAWLAERLKPRVELLLNRRLDRHGLRVENYEFLEQGG